MKKSLQSRSLDADNATDEVRRAFNVRAPGLAAQGAWARRAPGLRTFIKALPTHVQQNPRLGPALQRLAATHGKKPRPKS
jgi:hypothetical protein